jgi:1,4-dihydroxy-6-naphthoate synthase
MDRSSSLESRCPRDELACKTVAIPGTMTSAYLALRLYLGCEFAFVVVPFDRILDEVTSGRADAGLVIHEGQLTYTSLGLHNLVDLGVWWGQTHEGLPLPLGGNAVRKDLGLETMRALTAMYKNSIAFRARASRGGAGVREGLRARFG